MPVLRRFTPGGASWTDADIIDPAIDIPAYIRRFKATSTEIVFDVFGKASTAADALEVSVGAMTVDAYVAWESKDSVAPGTSPPATERPSLRRGKSVIDVEANPLPGAVRIVADAEKNGIGYLRLDLATISATAIEVVLVSGGRPL